MTSFSCRDDEDGNAKMKNSSWSAVQNIPPSVHIDTMPLFHRRTLNLKDDVLSLLLRGEGLRLPPLLPIPSGRRATAAGGSRVAPTADGSD